MLSRGGLGTVVVLIALVAAALALAPVSAGSIAVSELSKHTHIHGIAVPPGSPSRIYMATHHGFFVVSADGMASRLSEAIDDFMGFTPHPTDPAMLYASGHPAGGGKLGIITSIDGGRTWRQIAEGFNGPVDFHQMDVSRADPAVIYGVHGDLQVSRDGGHTWQVTGRLPDGLVDLTASTSDADTVYAATKGGLFMSSDGGGAWRPAYMVKRPVTMVQSAPDGALYAFVFGSGLIRATEPGLDWQLVSDGFGEGYLLHLAVDPADPAKLYAVDDQGSVLASLDGGRTWAPLGGP